MITKQDAIKLALEALKVNHEWHIVTDDHDGYPDSELCNQNTKAIAALSAISEQPVQDGDALRKAIAAFKRLTESLMPSFEYVGVSLRVSQEDHAEIRSALAGANTALHILSQSAQPSDKDDRKYWMEVAAGYALELSGLTNDYPHPIVINGVTLDDLEASIKSGYQTSAATQLDMLTLVRKIMSR